MRPKNNTYLIALLFLANNLVWLYFFDHSNPSQSNMQIVSANATHISASKEILTVSSAHIPEHNKIKDAKISAGIENNLNSLSKPLTQSPEASHRESAIENDSVISEFFASDEQRKLELVENLSARGKGLDILDEILRVDTSSVVRIAAIRRLHLELNEATTNLLLRTLDDPASEVSVIALNTLISSGDPALAPILNEKMHTLPEGSIKNFYAESLQRLDMSITMGMDNLTQQ
jgi:hypothetical protein